MSCRKNSRKFLNVSSVASCLIDSGLGVCDQQLFISLEEIGKLDLPAGRNGCWVRKIDSCPVCFLAL